MNHVTYISAGAGSGKTYTLTAILSDLIINKNIKPEEFILTTFTEAAAKEFRTKARERIFSHQEFDHYAEMADRLNQAQIGTIDGVANYFVRKYWYLLKISPELKVINDIQKKIFIGQILSGIASSDEIDFLNNFCEEFGINGSENFGLNYDFWKDDVKNIFDKAKSYNVTDFTESKTESLAFAESICGEKDFDIDSKKIVELLKNIESVKPKRNSEDRNKNLIKYKFLFNNGVEKTLNEYKGFNSFLEKLPADFSGVSGLDAIKNTLGNITTSKKAKDLITKYISLIFDFAEKALEQYEELKIHNHLIDYIDMENRFIELLNMEEVRNDIRSTYRYVFVDEFQDSSPVQVQIFDLLSEIIGRDEDDNQLVKIGEPGKEKDFYIHNSIWVGDFKQAIYGFRGADTDLTKAVADIVEGKQSESEKFKLQSLDTSYRSLEQLVEFSNFVFKDAFSDLLSEEQIVLKPKREQPQNYQSLICWPGSVGGNSTAPKMAEVAQKIATRLNEGGKPSDYAVLTRNNSNLMTLASELNKLGIPVKLSLKVDESRDEFNLICALLNLVLDKNDDFSRAVIAFLTQKDFGVDKIIETRLDFNQKYTKYQNDKKTDENAKRPEFLDSNDLIKTFMKKHQVYQEYTVHNLVESLIIDLNLFEIVKTFKDSQGAVEVLQAILEATLDYEQLCSEIGISPSISGFIDYAKDNVETAGSTDGVTLYTFHSSKGLEWKHVVFIDLNDDQTSNLIKYDVFGVQKYHKEKPVAENLYPNMIINVFPNIFGGNLPENDEMLVNIKNTSRFDEIVSSCDSELKRLLYVAITRARDELILTTNYKKEAKAARPFAMFDSIGNSVSDGVDSHMEAVDIFGNPDFSFKVQDVTPAAAYNDSSVSNQIYKFTKKSENAYEAKLVQPSKYKTDKQFKPELLCKLNSNINLENTKAESSEVGTCIHDIFCIMETAPSISKIELIIKGFNLENKIKDVDSIFETWKDFYQKLTDTYGKPVSTAHETPFRYFGGEHIVNGSIDFIWRSKNGSVLIDFKTFPGDINDTLQEGSHYAGNYSGQFECYENVLKANGESVIAKIVFYPVGGALVELKEGDKLSNSSGEILNLSKPNSQKTKLSKSENIYQGENSMSVFKMPKPVSIMGRSSSITNSFVNGIIPAIKPTKEQIINALSLLGQTEDNVRCVYCGDKMTEWDHLHPLIKNKESSGYITEINNLVPACSKCNQSKGNSNWREWMYSDAKQSPKTRGISDIDERAKTIEEYDRLSKEQFDLETAVGEENWEEYLSLRAEINEAMVKAQDKMNELKEIIQKQLQGTNKNIQNPVSENMASIIEDDDLFDDLQEDDIDIEIKEKLHGIGNEFFVNFYDILADRTTDNKTKTNKIHSLNNSLNETSITNRVSNSNTIFNKNWNIHALELIIASKNTKTSTINLAQSILDNSQSFTTSQYPVQVITSNATGLYPYLKIGQLANEILRAKLESGDASDQEIEDMQTLTYSKQNFGINFPLLIKTNAAKTESRYYSKLLYITNHQTQITETYRLCAEWYETTSNNDRPLLEAWLISH